MEPTITMLIGAPTAELVEQGVQGITSWQDLSIITHDNIMTILPGRGLLTRRKLLLVGEYIRRGHVVTAFMHGSGMHLLQITSVADNGRAPFASIKEWYGSAATSQSIINHYQKELEGLKLDANTTPSEYVNVLQICCQKVEAKNKGYTTATERQGFLDQILYDHYNVVIQNLQGNSDLALDDCCIRCIRQREQVLQIDAGKSMKKARCFKKDETKPKAAILQMARSQVYKAALSTR
jgi:hypothetical protein